MWGMLPLIYVAAMVPLFVTSLVLGFVHLFMPASVNPTVSAAVSSIAVLYYLVLVFASLFVRAVRGTYGSLVGLALGALAVVILFLSSTTYNPFNWIYAVLWGALLVYDFYAIKSFVRVARFTRAEVYNPDSFSRRLYSGTSKPWN